MALFLYGSFNPLLRAKFIPSIALAGCLGTVAIGYGLSTIHGFGPCLPSTLAAGRLDVITCNFWSDKGKRQWWGANLYR